MKRFAVVLAVLMFLVSFSLTAQTVLVNDTFATMGSWQAAYGDWQVRSGGLIQSDVKASMAKANRPAMQSGVVEYNFNVRYVSGGFETEKDLQSGYYHGGFGIHIAVDKPHDGMSWGNGKSYLLWLNLDTRPETKAEYPDHYGFRAQVYKSLSNSDMQLMDRYNLSLPMKLLKRDYLNVTIPVRIVVDTNTGLVKVYDPTVENYVYRFYLDGDLTGSAVSFRTNSLGVQFDNFKVTKLR